MLADDGRYYVVKFRNNPQHQRILINELLSYVLLDYLSCLSRQCAIVNVPQQSVDETPQLTLQSGSRTYPCEAGLHFGSQYPGNPCQKAVYDYLPLSLLRTVSYVEAFSGMVAFDMWVSNADGRQAIFFRERVKNQTANSGKGTKRGSSLVYVAKMIDHGFAFEAQTGSSKIHLSGVSTAVGKSTNA